MTHPLSPAAQAVLDAAYARPLRGLQPSIAAALRAAADQVGESESAEELRAIAAELVGADG